MNDGSKSCRKSVPKFRLIILTFGVFACAAAVACGDSINPSRTRREFAEAMGKLKKGVPEAEVLGLLGHPDDIRTEHDPGGFSTTDTKKIWRYGTSGHLTTATLGEIYIDKNGRVQYVFGKGTPPPEGMFEERELRRLLDALDHVPSYCSGSHYNPRKVIRAVNLLQPLGKEKALVAIDEFLRVASYVEDNGGREGVFLVLRVLFEVPADPGHMPPMLVGTSSPSKPKDPKLLPRFPIAVEGDIPFLLVRGYRLTGHAEQPESHMAYFRKNGTLRAKPLVPSHEPFRELERFEESPRWIFKDSNDLDDDQRGRELLREQVLRLIDTVYRVEPGVRGDLLPYGDKNAAHAIVREASNLRLIWDAKAQNYTFLDGTTLLEPELKHYRREIWRPTVAGLDIELIMERDGPRYVRLWIVENYHGKPSPTAVLKVFDVKAKDKPLVELTAGDWESHIPEHLLKDLLKGTTGTKSTSKSFDADEGTQVQVQVLAGEKSQLSPIFKP